MGARAALSRRRISQRAGAQAHDRNMARRARQRSRRSRNVVGGGAPAPRFGQASRQAAPRQSYRAPVATTSTGRYTRPSPPPQERAGRIKEVKPPPPPPSIKQFLGSDTGYQDQLRQFAKAMSDFRADAKRRKGVLTGEHEESERALGEQRVSDLEDIEQDFAGRGLLKSGLYGGAVGDYEEEFGERQSDLERRLKQALGQLSQERQKFKSQTGLKRQTAKEEAIRRRAEKYGL